MLNLKKALLAAALRVRASSRGVVSVSEDGEETAAAARRPPRRSRKTLSESIEAEGLVEPPTKRARGRSRKEQDADESETPSVVPKRRGRPRKVGTRTDDETGVEAEVDEDMTPVGSTHHIC